MKKKLIIEQGGFSSLRMNIMPQPDFHCHLGLFQKALNTRVPLEYNFTYIFLVNSEFFPFRILEYYSGVATKYSSTTRDFQNSTRLEQWILQNILLEQSVNKKKLCPTLICTTSVSNNVRQNYQKIGQKANLPPFFKKKHHFCLTKN